jgi:uncharacterized protein
MSSTHVVAASIAFLALLLTGLSIHVSRLRLRHRVSFGDGGHKDLLVAMRAHGNALEHTTLFAALALAAVALPPLPTGLAVGACAAFVAARMVHVWAVFARRLVLRQAAHAASTLVHVVLALGIGWALWQTT